MAESTVTKQPQSGVYVHPHPPPMPSGQSTYYMPEQPPGYTQYPYPQPPPDQQGPTTTVIIPTTVTGVPVCPACRVGVLQTNFTCLGIMCAIVFFPIGILCCMFLTDKRCTHCRANYL